MRTMETTAAATVRLRTEQFDRHMARRGATNDLARARVLGLRRSTIARARSGENRPGNEFIAACLACWPELHFEDLFELELATEGAA